MGAEWNTILLPIQFAKRLPTAELQLARSLAHIHEAEILLLHVVPLSVAVTADAGLAAKYYLEAEREARAKLERMARSRLKGHEFHVYVEIGDPAATIVKQAARLHADLVIMATHSRTGIKHFLLGSVAEHVVRRSPCAVLTVRPG
jgi:nucleotide-binding universal stress UspA family protein